MEQLPLDLKRESVSNLESLSESELINLYKEKVGVPPRAYDKAVLISALNDPESELARLGEIDREEDKAELTSLYKR